MWFRLSPQDAALIAGVVVLTAALTLTYEYWTARKRNAANADEGAARASARMTDAAPASDAADSGGAEVMTEEAAFERASAHARTLNVRTNNAKLALYRLYKQATEGDAPSGSWSLDPIAAAKAREWASIRGMSKEAARREYIDLVRQLDPAWTAPRVASGSTASAEAPSQSTSAIAASEAAAAESGASEGSWVATSRPIQDAIDESELSEDIHHMCALGRVRELERRLASSDNVNAVNDVGETLLHVAADAGQLEVVQLLLSKGATVNAVEAEAQQTPLHYAAAVGHKEVAIALVRAGANLRAADATGATPLDEAEDDAFRSRLMAEAKRSA